PALFGVAFVKGRLVLEFRGRYGKGIHRTPSRCLPPSLPWSSSMNPSKCSTSSLIVVMASIVIAEGEGRRRGRPRDGKRPGAGDEVASRLAGFIAPSGFLARRAHPGVSSPARCAITP